MTAAFEAYLPPPLCQLLWQAAEPSPIPGLRIRGGLQARFAHLLTEDALAFVVTLARRCGPRLQHVLARRREVRAFVDRQTLALVASNEGIGIAEPDHATVIGRTDADGQVVVGPIPHGPLRSIHVPDWLAGYQVTLFGPPDTARMCIHAMNALHRRLPAEPALVAELVEASGQVPRWGADAEDSKTPLPDELLQACDNLIRCFDGTLEHHDVARDRHYALAARGLSRPIKRICGLALPDAAFLVDGRPLPLHLVDFALHLFHNRARAEALVFYVPKLEDETEAAYLAELIEVGEGLIAEHEEGYTPGSVRVILVFETARALFRVGPMADALHPWFLGGSLGWHDFLASAARLFRHDPAYRIPVKADPDIVIRHIRESHDILVRTLSPAGGLCIGGMYGTLYEDGNDASFQASMVGYIRDVVTQLRRGLHGFWVAHPDFVRIGIALVEAWERDRNEPGGGVLDALVSVLVTDPMELARLREFLAADDVAGLPGDDPRYARAVLAATLEASPVVENSDPEEVRYNVFQALQYLAAWLSGTGCVALPAALTTARGERVFVRVMDDLATTERSRWELWAEVHHGRVPVAMFERIVSEEVAFLRGERDDPARRVQVPWRGDLDRWYPIAVRVLRQLVLEPDPVEAVSELLLPFTTPPVREASDPWAAAAALCPGRYR